MICPLCQSENVDDSDACFTCGRPLNQTPTITRGSVVDSRYEVLSPLGKGGMGMVFKAHDRVLDEIVALKTLRWDVAREPEVARRFRAETKLARKVRHRNVCGIHEYGDAGGLRYIAMELVDGVDLRRLLKDNGPVPTEDAFDMALQITQGLEAIHKAGVIHRDLKTPNIMRDSKGIVRLMDFGIAKQSGSETTLGGQVVGTPEYMSPEQARGHKVSFRSDIYALGIVIFEIFTGRVPFNAETPIATILKQLHDPPPLDGPAAAAIPPPLIPVLRRALQKLPADRYASAREMLEALEQAREAWRNPTPGTEVPEGTGTRATPAGGVAAALASSAEPLPASPTPSPTVVPTHVPTSGASPLPDPATATLTTPAQGPPATARPRSSWTVALPAAAAAGFVVWMLMRGEPVPSVVTSPEPPITGTVSPTSTLGPAGEAPPSTTIPSSLLTPTAPLRPSASPRPPRTSPSAAANVRERGPEPGPSGASETPGAGVPSPSPAAPTLAPAPPPPVSTTLAADPTPRPRPPGVRRGDLVRDGPGVRLPKVLKATPPAYPPAAERLRRDATVVLEALIDENGKVLEVRLTQPDPSRLGFNEAAAAAARTTTFEPATKDGIPVRMWFPMKLTFSPREPGDR